MGELEQLFKNNKSTFDRLEAKEELWISVKKAIDKPVLSGKIVKKKQYTFLKIAAAVLLLITLSGTWFLTEHLRHSPFENISMISHQGEPVALDPSLNKLTLVQFWESGNVLCTEKNCYYFLPAYEKYKDHGFEIYAISLDKNKEAWLAEIEKDELPWIHVSDLKGWDSPICIDCNITKVPTSFLLDQKGKIIARDLNAEDLDATLDKLLAQN